MFKEPENVKDINNKAIDYDEAFEMTGHGWYNRFMLVACCVTTNAVALDMFGFSVVVAAARCDLAIGVQETGLLASAPFAGCLTAIPWGYCADVHGRRRALLVSTSVGFLFAALSSFASSWQMMLALKLIGCCFSTAGFTLTAAYLGECTGTARRSRYQFILNSINLASEFVAFSLALLVLPLTFTAPLPWFSIVYRSWRLYTLILALPLGLGALMIFFLYESPKFLANIGQTDQALEVMKKIYTMNYGKRNEHPVKSLVRVGVKSNVSFWSSVVKQTVPLFRPPLVKRTLQLAFLMAVCCSTNNVFLMWFPSVVNIFFNSLSSGNRSHIGFCQHIQDNTTVIHPTSETGFITCDDTISLNTIYSGISLGLFFTLLNLSASKVAQYRRLVLISILLLATVSCLLVGLLKHPLASLVFFALVQCTAVGLGNVLSYCVDLYPTSYRGLVTSFAAMMGRLSSFTGVIVIGNVIIEYCNVTFYLWAVLTLSGVGVSLLLPPDRQSNVVR